MNIYQEILMDHYHHPKNYGTLEHPNFIIKEHNPSCGDSVSFQGIINDAYLKELKFTAQGCVISIATASLLSEIVMNKNLAMILSLDSENIQELIGITLGPLRMKCALLALHALQQGIRQYKKQT